MATSDGLPDVPSEAKLLMSPCQHVGGKLFPASSTTAEWQTRACECLETSMANTTSPHFLITNWIQKVCLLLRQTPVPQEIARTTLQRKGYRGSLRFAQRRRGTELCPRAKDMNTADNAYSTSAATLGRIMLCYADGGRVLELLFVLTEISFAASKTEMGINPQRCDLCTFADKFFLFEPSQT